MQIHDFFNLHRKGTEGTIRVLDMNVIKYLLSILGILSLGLFASCGGSAEAECCSDSGECCKEGEHEHGEGEGNASE